MTSELCWMVGYSSFVYREVRVLYYPDTINAVLCQSRSRRLPQAPLRLLNPAHSAHRTPFLSNVQCYTSTHIHPPLHPFMNGTLFSSVISFRVLPLSLILVYTTVIQSAFPKLVVSKSSHFFSTSSSFLIPLLGLRADFLPLPMCCSYT